MAGQFEIGNTVAQFRQICRIEAEAVAYAQYVERLGAGLSEVTRDPAAHAAFELVPVPDDQFVEKSVGAFVELLHGVAPDVRLKLCFGKSVSDVAAG